MTVRIPWNSNTRAPARVADAPILLSMAGWFGTLAAVRELGRRGIPVVVGSGSVFEHSGWSRYARRIPAPHPREPDAYVRWLLETGRRSPGMVLCATSDDLCFLHAAHERELREHFRLATPPLATVRELLDKQLLYRNAERAGLRVPATLFPRDAAHARNLATDRLFPLLLKQRTQVLSRTLHKGTPVADADAVLAAFERFRRENRFPPELLAVWPDIDRPALQEYLPESAQRIYCLEGFLNRRGNLWATRAAVKVLSHPRYLGVGILFEHAGVLPALEERVLRLCRSVGYSGLFQCEFIEHQGEHLLIDFNPRFFNYMAFDHARGLPLAYLAYLDALGADAEVDAQLTAARRVPPEAANTVYCYRLGATLQLGIERAFRRIPNGEAARWRAWRRRAAKVVDPAWDPEDRAPALADFFARIAMALRHPRSFLRSNTRPALPSRFPSHPPQV